MSIDLILKKATIREQIKKAIPHASYKISDINKMDYSSTEYQTMTHNRVGGQRVGMFEASLG